MILCLVSLAQRGVLETRPPNCTCQLFALTSDTSELRGRTWSVCVREPTRGSPTENTIKTWWHSFPVVPPSLSLSLLVWPCPPSGPDDYLPRFDPRTSLTPTGCPSIRQSQLDVPPVPPISAPSNPPSPTVHTSLDRTNNHQAAWTAFSFPSSSSPTTVTWSWWLN